MLHEPGGSNPDSNPRRDSLWDSHPGRSGVRNAVESMVESIGQTLGQAVESVARTEHRTLGQLVGGGGGEGRTKRTAWDVIREGRSSRRFAQLLEKHDRVRRRLEDGDEALTVFVPTDDAFAKIESELARYSDEFVERVLEYHVIEDEYTAARILGVHTMPTMLRDRELGGGGKERPQRLRVSVGLTGMHLNFYSQVVVTNVESSNGVIHAVDQLLIPPPRQGNIVEAIPAKFSTFTFAMETTGLAEELESEKQRCGTVFVPTNTAWAKLGQAANSFLFSDKGAPYLRTLLEYHIASNETLYSDAFYESDEGRRHRGDHGRHGGDNDRHTLEEEGDGEDMTDSHRRHHGGHRHRFEFEDELSFDEEEADDDGDDVEDEMRRGGRNKHGRHGRRPGRHHRRLYASAEDYDDDEGGVEDTMRGDHSRHGRHGHHGDHGDHGRHGGRHDRHGRRPGRHHGGGGHHSQYPISDNDDNNKKHREHRHPRQDDLDSIIDTEFPRSHRRIELPTLAGQRTLRVDVQRWMGLVGMIVNGRYHVTVQDGIARDGVVHVVESVITPPRRAGRKGHEEDEAENRDLENVPISVDELRERLRPIVEGGRRGRHGGERLRIDL